MNVSGITMAICIFSSDWQGSISCTWNINMLKVELHTCLWICIFPQCSCCMAVFIQNHLTYVAIKPEV